MLRNAVAVAAILLFLGGLLAPGVYAGVPKVVLCEEFGATW